MKKNEKEIDFFGDGMLIFLNYIARQYKKNQDYKPHPVIRAFECALQGINDAKFGEKTMGFSTDGTDNSAYEPYVVVLEEQETGIEVKEIRNIKVDKQLPLDLMVMIFRLQIHLDRIKGNTVNPQQMVDVLNEVIPGNRFYALGDRWKEARDLFKEKVEKKEFHLPKNEHTQKWIDELLTITQNTPWEDYSNSLRSLIGGSILDTMKEEDRPQIVITSPIKSDIEKYKVFDSAVEILLGKSAEYLKQTKK